MHTRLSRIIIDRINNEGPLSFRDFMEMALYHPESGYYTSPRNKIGRSGDFYTSAYVTRLFGDMLATQLEEMWRLTGEKDFTIVEYGAGTGMLCRDILAHLKKNPDLYRQLRYCIIEKSPAMRQIEKSLLTEKVTWHDSISEISGFTGCVLSNELLDNFSVHRVTMREELMEIYVGYNDGFFEIFKPASAELKNYFLEQDITLPEGSTAEVSLQPRAWLGGIAAAMDKGFVMTIDYGHPASILYNDSRCTGTLVCYAQHTVNNDPYSGIGEQDITAHVNFSALHNWGLECGLEYCGFVTQASFMHGLGLVEHIRQGDDADMPISKKVFLLHTFFTDMGNKFKILIQQKGLFEPVLSGLRLAEYLPESAVGAARLPL